MNELPQRGVFVDRGYVWTENRVPGRTVYGEKLRVRQGREYRHWNPHRSKLAALLQKDPQVRLFGPGEDVLYLGAASGTTVSHLSDRQRGLVYAVEFSARAVRDLLWNVEPRDNVVPIFDDAFQPQRYQAYIGQPVGAMLQDVAQRHQVDIFLRNLPFVKKGGQAILFVKARSIHVAKEPRDIYAEVARRLKEAGCDVVRQTDLDPFERDHRAFVVQA